MNEIEKQDDVLAAMIEGFEAEREELATKDGDHFCNWYLRILNQAKADEKKVEEMSAIMLQEISSRRKALQYAHGQEFRNRITAKVETQTGKKKSVNFLMGTAGFRTTPESIVFTDVEKAKLWAIENFDDEELTASISGIRKTTGVVAVLFSKLLPREFASVISGLNKTPFAEYIKNNVDTETGEVKIPPGVELVAPRQKFYPQFDQPQLPEPEKNDE